MSFNSTEQLREGNCQKCGQHKGDTYSFYYGKKISTTSTRYMNTTVRRTEYDIAGQMLAAVCSECIRHRRVMGLATFGLMVVVGGGLALWAAGWDTFADETRISEAVRLQMFTLGVAGLLGLIGLWDLLPNPFAGKNTHAENLITHSRRMNYGNKASTPFGTTRTSTN